MANETRDSKIERWKALITEANESGMSRKAWCAKKGISLRQFYYWLSQTREEMTAPASCAPIDNPPVHPEPPSPRNPCTVPSFYEVPLPLVEEQAKDRARDASSFSAELVLEYGGCRILVNGGTSAVTLARVLSVIPNV